MEWFWLILIIAIPIAIFGSKNSKQIVNKKLGAIFLITGLVMTLLAIIFCIYALNHPNLSYPWNNYITYAIYVVYIVTNISMYILSYRFSKKEVK